MILIPELKPSLDAMESESPNDGREAVPVT